MPISPEVRNRFLINQRMHLKFIILVQNNYKISSRIFNWLKINDNFLVNLRH